MRWFNHIVGGVAFTGIFASFAGENILQTPSNLACTLVCAMIPDIDIQSSPIGRMFWFISRPIQKKYGHRTITHSIFFLLFILLVAHIFGFSKWICGLAFISHVLFDCMTVEGVQFFYPMSHKKVVIPGNRSLRFSVADTKSEIMLLGFFSFSLIFAQPLMSNGFWTTFNQSFALPQNLYSEFIKSRDLIEVTYNIQRGSVEETNKGFLIACEREDHFKLLRNDSFIDIDAQKLVIKSLIPNHTNRVFKFVELTFINVSPDSLNSIIHQKHICEIKADANQMYTITENSIPKKEKNIWLKYPNILHFQSIDTSLVSDKLFGDTDFESERIRNELQTLQNRYTYQVSEYQRVRDTLEKYTTLAITETDPILKEQYQRKRNTTNTPDSPQKDWVRERELTESLRIAAAKFNVEQQKRQFENAQTLDKKLKSIQQTQITGVLKYVIIQ